MNKIFSITTAVLLSIIFVVCLFAQPYENVSASIHIQSDISDGRHSLEDLVQLAEKNSVRILILSDTFLRRWEYGLWPWRNLIKKVFEEKSVLRLGIKNYFSLIEQVQRKNPRILIVPAVEVGPFYYWEGNIFSGERFSLFHWHKKMLVLGLKETLDYRKLPAVANYVRFPQRASDFFRFWPILLMVMGVVLIWWRPNKDFSFRGYPLTGYVNSFSHLKYILIALGVISLINNFSFSASPYDSYHGEKNEKPYQYLIDYVNAKDGAIFWLHPESNYTREVAGVKIITYSYKDDLLTTKDYQGFSGIYADNITVTQPGDMWDRILLEFCRGTRGRPVWVMGEAGFDGFNSKEISGIETVFLLSKIGQDEIIRALREGRMYAKLNRQKNDLSLARFMVTDQKINTVGIMGDDIKIHGRPRIEIKLTTQSHPAEEMIVKLIRGDKVVQELQAVGPDFIWDFTDEECPLQEKTFYRLEMDSGFCRVLSNPIFVTAD